MVFITVITFLDFRARSRIFHALMNIGAFSAAFLRSADLSSMAIIKAFETNFGRSLIILYGPIVTLSGRMESENLKIINGEFTLFFNDIRWASI